MRELLQVRGRTSGGALRGCARRACPSPAEGGGSSVAMLLLAGDAGNIKWPKADGFMEGTRV
jgi:hypothetical protein